jgi:hypothetical protein
MPSTTLDYSAIRRKAGEADAVEYPNSLLLTMAGDCLTFDEHGRAPDDTEYITTYDIARLVADVWDEKAAAASCCFDYSGDGANLQRSQIADNYRKQASRWRARSCPRVMRVIRDGTQTMLEEIEDEENLNTGEGNA